MKKIGSCFPGACVMRSCVDACVMRDIVNDQVSKAMFLYDTHPCIY